MTDQQPTPDNDADIATPVIESDGRPTASDHETPRRQGRWTGFTHRHPTGAVVGAGVVGLLVGAVAAAAVITITAPAPELPARAAAPWALGPIPRHLELGNRPPMPDQPAPPPPPPPDATATALVHPLPGGGRVILVADTTQTTQMMGQLRRLMIGAGLATLAVAALLLVAASRAALRPLERLTQLAKSITTGDRGRRLRPDRPDTELGRAASAFDGMLDALEASEHRAQRAAEAAQRAETATRRFLVDAAHELRTPMAGIQAAAEQLVSNASQRRSDPAARRQYRRATLLLSDARRAARLVADMLDLSRIDAGLPLDRQDCDLAGIVDTEADRTAMLAPQLTVTRTGVTTLPLRADPTRVAQIVSNLLDNARRHTRGVDRSPSTSSNASTMPR